MQDLLATTVVLRVLNGPMQGCEFRLGRPRTLFVVGAEEIFCVPGRLAAIPEDAIYIPLDREGCNFEVLLSDDVSANYELRLLNGEDVQDRTCEFQTLQEVAGLRIALKLEGEEWNPGLSSLKSLITESLIQSPIHRTWQYLLAGVGGVLVLVLIWIGSGFGRSSTVSTVEALIAGSNSTMPVLTGRDQLVYVFALSERDANWGRQVLVRNGFAATQVLTVPQERNRLESVLADIEPQLAYHYLDFSDLTRLRLLVSSERNLLTPEMRRRIESEMLKVAPYALEFIVEPRDDAEFELKAEQGLKRLGIPFKLQRNTDSVNFTMVGSFDDGELHALADYVTMFQQQWGGRYVYFSIELKDDWLKGRSFQYGANSYIKMTPSSWYFSPPM